MVKFVRYSDKTRSALYKDGKLVEIGEETECYHYLSGYLDIDERDSTDFYLGGVPQYRSVADTLEEIEAYTAQKSESRKEILTKIQYRFMQIESLYEEIETLRGMLHE